MARSFPFQRQARKVAAFSAGLGLLLGPACSRRAPEFSDSTADLEARVRNDPRDFAGWNRLAEARLQLLGTTGDLSHLARAAEAIENSVKIVPVDQNRGALAMRARVEMASHHFEDARRSSEELRALLPESAYPLQGLGDALFQLGDYDDAERVWSEVVAKEGASLATEPRLAQLDFIHGGVERARQRLEHALELAKSSVPPLPEAVASCHLRLGELAFRSGDWEKAEMHYGEALSLQREDYSTLEHLAELRGAQGKQEEAVALYTRLIARTQRPELMQALGDLYVFAHDSDRARQWHDRAEEAFLASVARGEAGCFHHLAGFYADSRNNPEKAVEWARRDLALRHGIQVHDALAWALCKAGQLTEASDAIAMALATGTRDPHILYHAAMIRMSAGDLAGGKEALEQARLANPRYNSFHVHR